MSVPTDPYALLGVARDADQSAIHAAYRRAVRRTHPDAGGTAAEFEAVQSAYETLRGPAARGAHGAQPRGTSAPPRTAPADGSAAARSPADGSAATGAPARAMEDLLADSRRLEDEARRLAGLPPHHGDPEPEVAPTEDSMAAILREAAQQVRDAAQQVRDAAREGAHELRRRARRRL